MRTRLLKRLLIRGLLGALCLVGLELLLYCALAAATEPNKFVSSADMTIDKDGPATGQQQIDAQGYRPSKQMVGLHGEKLSEPMWHIDNRSQGFKSAVNREGWEIVPRQLPKKIDPKDPTRHLKKPAASKEQESKWYWRYRFEALARGAKLMKLSAPEVRNKDETVYLRYSPVVSEWYKNSKLGIEQGFEIKEKPHAKGKGELVLVGEVKTDLAVLNPTKEKIGFSQSGAEVVRYAGLKVIDASGKTLPSWLSYSENGRAKQLLIHVDDSAAVYPLVVDPLATSPAWTGESNQTGAYFGSSVASAGDVNGDGYSDVIVGAFGYSNGESGEGQTYLFLGSATGPSTIPAWTAESDQVSAQFGFSVASAGDVNGDGYSDVVVGALYYDNGEGDEGQSYLYLGSASGLSSTAAWTAESDQAMAQFGYSVAGAGDVNGDGYSDVVVGANAYDNGENNEGRAHLYLGSASGLSSTADWTAESNQSALFGWSVASAGDVNGDGYSDVVVGAVQYSNPETHEGGSYLFLGAASGLSTIAAWTAESDQNAAWFGCSVASAGDVNGDGYSDVVVGARYYDNAEGDEGRAYLYLGSASGLASGAAWIAESNQNGAEFGGSVASAGNVNGDGYSDLAVGAPYYDNGESDEGRSYLYMGSASGLATSEAWTGESDQASANFGTSVASAGDVNGEGASDVVIGASFYMNGEANEGGAFLYLGILDATPTPTHTPTATPIPTLTPTSTPTPQGGDPATATPTPTPVIVVPGQKNLPPPTVQVVGDDVTVTMPQATPKLTGKALTKAMKLLMARGLTKQQATKALKTLVITYVLKISNVGGASVSEIDALGKSTIIRSRNNQISRQNLAPGNYSSSYTIQISTKKPAVPLGSTQSSRATNFRVS
jgi:hypothetical protein